VDMNTLLCCTVEITECLSDCVRET